MSQTSDLFFWDSTVHTYLYVCNMCPEYICEYNTHIYFLGVAFLNNYIYRSELRGALKTLAKEKTSNSRLYIMPCQDHLLPLHYRTLYIYISRINPTASCFAMRRSTDGSIQDLLAHLGCLILGLFPPL